MKYPQLTIIIAFLVFTSLSMFGAKADSHSDSDLGLFSGLGKVIIVRHAIAPGMGDPDNFNIGDCSTQRNLDASGREQALSMGEWLRSQGVERARVYSSQWCRCKDTAELMKFGPVKELPALNSFFQRREEKDSNMRSLRHFLSEQTLDGSLIILVTHQVTITALTGVYPGSGTGVMLLLDGEGGFDIGPLVLFE
ncbi:histidine phosphatase family protein [Psychromonas sp.]|uniref:histidine phosphatase family protein n=1 Tax=Psychromonas sp. TaxID=1884585 RepID=UPI00356691BB